MTAKPSTLGKKYAKRDCRAVLAFLITSVMMVLSVQAAEKPVLPSYEDEQIRLRIFPRTTEQMSAFFEARGFPKRMLAELEPYCFFTVVIENKSKNIIWLELKKWSFSSAQKRVRRIPRSQWLPLWDKMNIPLAAQSTFRWTLLPERLDFQPDENEGGNVILEKSKRPFSLVAQFDVEPMQPGNAVDKFGIVTGVAEIVVRIDNFACGDAVKEKKP